MIQIFKHRCNTIMDLQTCQSHWGVEIDLRSDIENLGDLHLAHDPWMHGESFKTWLKEFIRLGIRGPIILNTKEDSLETLALELLQQAGVHQYIFLDTTIPTLKKWTREKSNPHFFIRWSSIEPLELSLAHKGYCHWSWVDCFDRIPPGTEVISVLNQHFKTCLVSPELQGGSEQEMQIFIRHFKNKIHGVCTKFPEQWEQA